MDDVHESEVFQQWSGGAMSNEEAYRRGVVVADYRRRGYTLETIELELAPAGIGPSRTTLGFLAKTWADLTSAGVEPNVENFALALQVTQKVGAHARKSLYSRIRLLPVGERNPALQEGCTALLRPRK